MLHVCPSVYQTDPTGRTFVNPDMGHFLIKPVGKLQICLKSHKITGTLHADISSFMKHISAAWSPTASTQFSLWSCRFGCLSLHHQCHGEQYYIKNFYVVDSGTEHMVLTVGRNICC
jgi:hypothetical protein